MRFGLARERIAAVGRGDGDCRLLGTAVPALLVLCEHVSTSCAPTTSTAADQRSKHLRLGMPPPCSPPRRRPRTVVERLGLRGASTLSMPQPCRLRRRRASGRAGPGRAGHTGRRPEPVARIRADAAPLASHTISAVSRAWKSEPQRAVLRHSLTRSGLVNAPVGEPLAFRVSRVFALPSRLRRTHRRI